MFPAYSNLQEINAASKIQDVIRGMTMAVGGLCSCTFIEADIQDAELRCSESLDNTVIFSANVSASSPSTAVELVCVISSWVESMPSLVVDNVMLKVRENPSKPSSNDCPTTPLTPSGSTASSTPTDSSEGIDPSVTAPGPSGGNEDSSSSSKGNRVPIVVVAASALCLVIALLAIAVIVVFGLIAVNRRKRKREKRRRVQLLRYVA